MTNVLSLQRILLALGVIVFVGAAAVGATGAFFNDTETSTGNTFAAGDIDLQIDNESFAIDYNMDPEDLPLEHVLSGDLIFNPATSWELTDLVAGTHKFFDFQDLKPGDYGEDTISIHVGSNDAYLCAAAQITDDSDQTCTEPEQTDENGACVDPNGPGELDDNLEFAFWVDDGDNVFESGEAPGEVENPTSDGSVFLEGPLSGLGLQGQIALADTSGNAPFGTSVAGDSTVYIGKIWCFGDLAQSPVPQDGVGNTYGDTPGSGTNGPDARGTGWLCNGAAAINNQAQTDRVQGDMQFYAVQARNNADFLCSEDYDPAWPETVQTLTITKVIVNSIGGDTADDFSFQIDGGTATPFEADGTNVVPVTAGAHDLSEVIDLDYGSVISGDCAADGTVNVPVSGNASCTITNTGTGQPT